MFDLTHYMEDKRPRIDATLDRVLPPEDETPCALHRAMRYSVFSGGKRLRPILCIAAAEALGGDESRCLPAAAAVELLHTYTLIHDDLPAMDNDETRRGRATCHVVFGEAGAILAGDALQALAFEVLASLPPPRATPTGELVRELAAAAGSRGVVGGQSEDISATRADTDEKRVSFVHRHKTADLFRAAVRIGALVSGARPPMLKTLTAYAVNLGLAFQIADDLLDAGPETDRELTCLWVCSAESARQQARDLAEEAVDLLARAGLDRAHPLAALARLAASRTH